MKRMVRAFAGFVAAFAPVVGAGPAAAAEACPGLVARQSPLVVPAALGKDEVGITFVGHATFLIESPGGIRVATDYNDYVRPTVTPDVATMNKAHATHFTHRPDPAIRHVLRGWNPAGGPASHDIEVGDVRIRNVVTNIRDWGGGTERDGNSIFVFQTADLCIAHLGHLHHTLTPEHLKQIGRIDVVLVPVDGSYTLDTEGMIEVLRALNLSRHRVDRGVACEPAAGAALPGPAWPLARAYAEVTPGVSFSPGTGVSSPSVSRT
jgi:L-ascorbate metabolism protein UlaG (beta-lactamase superfamily)